MRKKERKYRLVGLIEIDLKFNEIRINIYKNDLRVAKATIATSE